MPFKISTEPDGLGFTADEGQNILDAALQAGLLLPYGCRDGACGACKAQVLHGEVAPGQVAPGALSDAERDDGHVLLCQAQARSDVTIKVRSLGRIDEIAPRKLPCRVLSLTRAAADVMIVKLKLPASEPFRFRAGQYVDFLLTEGRRRSFSIANAPAAAADHIELHIRQIAGGQFTGHVFDTMKPRDILRFEGPLGSFYLREDRPRPVVLLAGGTGFAPIKSIVEHVIASGTPRAMTLYWGARNREGLYMDSLARSWCDTLPGFTYIPVLSEPLADDAWDGRTGWVHEAVMADLPDLSAHDVYACGAPAMIDLARAQFTEACQLAADAFFADAFTFAPASPA